jgi:hypothetical protein
MRFFARKTTKDLYSLTYDAPNTARLRSALPLATVGTQEHLRNEEVLIVDPETPITREEYEKDQYYYSSIIIL